MTSTTLSEKKLFAYLIGKIHSRSTCTRLICLLAVDDIELEEEEFKKLQGGNSLSQSKVGDIYYNKKGYTKAIEWYRLSAVENNVHA
jgi:TPR repeat protein